MVRGAGPTGRSEGRRGRPPVFGRSRTTDLAPDPAVRCEDLEGKLDPGHDDLLAAGASRSVFLTSDWLETWHDCFGPEHDLVSLALRRGPRLIGVAPLAITRPSRIGEPRRLIIAGQQPTAGEHLDLVAAPGEEAVVATAVAAAMTGAMRRRWDVTVIQRILADSPVLPHFAAALERAGCATSIIPTGPSPYTELPATIDELLAAKSKNFRSQVRQSRNRLNRLGEVEFAHLGDGLTLEEGLEELVRLHRARWADASSFDTDAKVDFHRRLSRRLADEDRLFLSLLKLDGATIGARYDFVHGGKIWCVQGGWDPTHSAARPGMTLTEDVLRWGIERGLDEYDFLGGEADYKTRWSTGERQLVTLVAANPATVRGRIYGLRRAARRRGGRSAGPAAIAGPVPAPSGAGDARP